MFSLNTKNDVQEAASTPVSNETFRIRTMQNDLDTLENPSRKTETTPTASADSQKRSMPQNRESNSALTPPFLTTSQTPPAQTQQPAPESAKSPSPLFTPFSPESSQTPEQENITLYSNEKSTSKGSFFPILVSILVVVAIFGGGAYYFWMTRIQNSNTPEPTIPQNQSNNTPTSILSASGPNYLPILSENMHKEGIQGTLRTAAKQVKESNINTPVEFIVTDQDNNPMTFPAFAAFAEIILPDALLASINGAFSVFMYNDSGHVRLALALKTSQINEAQSLLKASENTLASNMKPLLLESYTPKESSVFQDGLYKDTTIRYLNLDTTATTSIDYFFTSEAVFIATSKNTSRALIDALSR